MDVEFAGRGLKGISPCSTVPEGPEKLALEEDCSVFGLKLACAEVSNAGTRIYFIMPSKEKKKNWPGHSLGRFRKPWMKCLLDSQ